MITVREGTKSDHIQFLHVPTGIIFSIGMMFLKIWIDLHVKSSWFLFL